MKEKIEEIKRKINNQSKSIHLLAILIFIILTISTVLIIMFKYHIEGEKNPPFFISKILVVSVAEGYEQEQMESKWNFNIDQNNDIYITVNKNEDNNNEIIKKVSLENFNISEPEKGNIKIYKPSEEGIYMNDEKYIVEDRLEYLGSNNPKLKDIEISNQGGSVLIRISNKEVGKYVSDDEEIIHDGKLLSKTETKLEEIKFYADFDIIIETVKGIKYKTNITLELPTGNIIEEGQNIFEYEKTEDILLKRI